MKQFKIWWYIDGITGEQLIETEFYEIAELTAYLQLRKIADEGGAWGAAELENFTPA